MTNFSQDVKTGGKKAGRGKVQSIMGVDSGKTRTEIEKKGRSERPPFFTTVLLVRSCRSER
jgi:hypothetical protein